MCQLCFDSEKGWWQPSGLHASLLPASGESLAPLSPTVALGNSPLKPLHLPQAPSVPDKASPPPFTPKREATKGDTCRLKQGTICTARLSFISGQSSLLSPGGVASLPGHGNATISALDPSSLQRRALLLATLSRGRLSQSRLSHKAPVLIPLSEPRSFSKPRL